MLSGSVGKVANLGVPDIVLSNMSDVVDHCRRITRIADAPLMVDTEDGFGNAVNVVRTVREMEAAGRGSHRNRGQLRAAPLQRGRPRTGIHCGAGGQAGSGGSGPHRPDDGHRSPFRRPGPMPDGRGVGAHTSLLADGRRGPDAHRLPQPRTNRGRTRRNAPAPLRPEPARRTLATTKPSSTPICAY